MAEQKQILSRKEIIKIMAEDANISYKKMRDAMKKGLDAVIDGVAAGREVHFVNFGTFSTKYRPARDQVNPKTNETFKLDDDLLPRFKPGKAFKERVSANTGLKKKHAAKYKPKTPKHVKPPQSETPPPA